MRSRLIGRINASDVVAFASPLVVGAVGGITTASQVRLWYRTLDKPDWKPPDSAFGPVWATLYVMMGIAVVLARRAAPQRSPGTEAVFGIQLALNLAWSLVFFGRRDVRGGLVVIILLWAAIVANIAHFSRSSRLAAALLLPYLAWVSFAALLNAEIYRRNS